MKNKITKKKIILLIIMLFVYLSSVSAHWENRIGVGFTNHSAFIDKTEKPYFHVMTANTENIQKVIFIGPSLDETFIPYNKIPLGLNLSHELLFPIGYNKDQSFRSYNLDFKYRVMFGLSYNQSFTSTFGIFADFGYEFDAYHIASTNIHNSRIEPEYSQFTNHSLYGEVGFLSTIHNGYFKFGINYAHSLINNAYSTDMIFAGGVIF